jgi:hypothetical protein
VFKCPFLLSINLFSDIRRKRRDGFIHFIFDNSIVSVAARIVMTERKDSGPVRPCHIREAYRRLKLEGKIPRRTVPRLFR